MTAPTWRPLVDMTLVSRVAAVDRPVKCVSGSSNVRAAAPALMAFVGCCQQSRAQLFSSAPAGLDRVTVGAQRDHLYGMVASTAGEVIDVVDLKNRLAAIGEVG
jgi:hypothetical protein